MDNTRAAHQEVVLEHDGATGEWGAVPHILCTTLPAARDLPLSSLLWTVAVRRK